MTIAAMLLVVETALFAPLFMIARKRIWPLSDEYRQEFKLAALAGPFVLILEKLELVKRYPALSARVIPHLLTVYRCRHQDAGAVLNLFFAHALALAVAVHWLFVAADAAFGTSALTRASLLLLVVMPALLLRELGTKAKAIKQSMLIDLPELLTTLVLLINAGEQPINALIRCAELVQRKPESRLYRELVQVKKELANQFPFPHALEQFARRCGVQEVTAFASTMVMNYRRGGDELAGKLKEMSRECWEKRKNVARALGAEASAKMVFPLIFIFLAVMIVVAAPALMLMNE